MPEQRLQKCRDAYDIDWKSLPSTVTIADDGTAAPSVFDLAEAKQKAMFQGLRSNWMRELLTDGRKSAAYRIAQAQLAADKAKCLHAGWDYSRDRCPDCSLTGLELHMARYR